jgi:hypothetical protein
MSAVERTIPYQLVGAMKGKSGKFFGFKFVDGKAMIPESAHANCGRVLRDDFAAMPVVELQSDPERVRKALELLDALEKRGDVPATPVSKPAKEEVESEAERLEREEREVEEARIAAEAEAQEAAERADKLNADAEKRETETLKASPVQGKGKHKAR